MYLKVRKLSAKPGESDNVINISKMALIQELRKIIFDEIGVEVEQQRLFYKGKQLMDDYRVMDYDIQLNDVVQLLIKVECSVLESHNNTENETIAKNQTVANQAEESQNNDNCGNTNEEDQNIEGSEDGQIIERSDERENIEKNNVKETHNGSNSRLEQADEKPLSKYFKIGDAVDFIDIQHGAWLEGIIDDILRVENEENTTVKFKEPDLIFRIKVNGEPSNIDVMGDYIRPRSRYIYKKSELVVDLTVLVNYNIEKPTTRGFWYDFVIKKITRHNMKGTLLVGRDRAPIEDCTAKYVDEVLKIEESVLLVHRLQEPNLPLLPPRKTVYYCECCKDVATKPCKECGCKLCSGKENAEMILLCDECEYGYHTKCLIPPLLEVPSDPEWYCPTCKVDENEIVKAGDKLKFSNKKSKMVSSQRGNSSRDWGRGMACVGRTKECTIVSKDHYGPVPGVDVGTCWKFRLQVSEAGVHRPHVAGIHGRETDGAYSLVLSGGYVDDVDNGDEFIYSGSGGRDLSGNKRISEQSSNQTLTRMNKALALNCNAPLSEKGATAIDWKGGKPVRVIRNYKLSKHSGYAPRDGNRYDGIYKVVKYFPETGRSGFLVWKYVLRRDDPNPAPWEYGGQELEMLYPPGYEDAQSAKSKKSDSRKGKRGIKRKTSTVEETSTSKKMRVECFKLSNEVEKGIAADKINEKLWNECKPLLEEGKQSFLSKVEEVFMCICCQEVVYLPITMECRHIVCKSCLKRSFASQIFSCPCCRYEVDKNFKMQINSDLSATLLSLFPGYDAHR